MFLSLIISKLLPYISLAICFIPIVIGVVSFKTIKVNLLIIFSLITIGCLTEIVSLALPYLGFESNIIFINFYLLFETCAISIFYFSLLSKKKWKYFVLVSGSILMINGIYRLLNIDRNTLDSLQMTMQSLLVISTSLVVFYYQLSELKYFNITAVPIFWVNSAFLIYFGGNLFLHAFSNYLLKYELYSFFELWGIIHSTLNITFYLLISIAFWKSRKFRA